MVRGQHRRSARITELDAQRDQQEKSQNKGKRVCEVTEEDLDTGEDSYDLKPRIKKVESRPVLDQIVKTVEPGGQKIGHSSIEDRCRNAAVLSSRTALPERSKLELLLGILQRRDSRKIFAEPVNKEEVKGYYDIIKEPMDFGTISGKLNGGSYQTLEEFEHDVFLVASNAMYFNAANTTYYRQARIIRDLAKKLFDALRTNLENFTSEMITAQLRAGKRTKTEVEIPNIGTCNNSSHRWASKGSKYEKSENFVKDQRGTLRSENESIVSSFYEGPKPVIKIEQKAKEYKKSLMQFVQDLGPTAQMIAKKKLGRCTAEALELPINNVTSAQMGITSTPFFLQSCIMNQNLNSKMLDHTLYGVNASTFDSQHRNDAFSQGFVQGNDKMITSSNSSCKPVQQMREDGISLKQNIADQIIGSSYSSLDGKSNSVTWKTYNNSEKFISSSYDKGKNVQMVEPSLLYLTENHGDSHQNSVQAMSAEDTSLNYTGASQRTGGSNFSPLLLGYGNPYSSAAWNVNNDEDKLISSTAIDDKKVELAGRTSADARMQGSLFAIDRGSKSSGSFHWPSLAVVGPNSNQPHPIYGMYSNNLDCGGHQVQAATTRGNTNYGGSLVQADQALSWFEPTTPFGSKHNLNVPMKDQSRSCKVGAVGKAGYSHSLGWGTSNEQFAEPLFILNERHQTNSHGEHWSSGHSQNNSCQLPSPDDISWALRL